MNWELLRTLLPWILPCIAFAGSLVACRGIAARFWFTVALCCLPIMLAAWLYHYHWGGAVAYFEELRTNGGHDDPE